MGPSFWPGDHARDAKARCCGPAHTVFRVGHARCSLVRPLAPQ
jgi:hypothetical protein